MEPTSLHNAEPDRPNQPVHIWGVFHLTGVRPIVIELQLPEENGDILAVKVPVPDHPVFEAPAHGFEGLHVVVENLQRRNVKRPFHWVRGKEQERTATLTIQFTAFCLLIVLRQPLSSIGLCPERISQLSPVLVQEGQGAMGGLNMFLAKAPLENASHLLTNCSWPPSRGRKFQVTVSALPTGAKLEKVHFSRTSVPFTASSAPEV